jgi:hypothetical protein
MAYAQMEKVVGVFFSRRENHFFQMKFCRQNWVLKKIFDAFGANRSKMTLGKPG